MCEIKDARPVGAIIMDQVTLGKLKSQAMISNVDWRDARWSDASAKKGIPMSARDGG